MVSKSKPPIQSRRVYANDLTVEVGGVTYYPHAGEWVEFKGRPSIGLYLKFTQLGSQLDALALLAEQIIAWDWTDDEGTPYESPPSFDTIMKLQKEELGWLLSNVSTEGISEEALKNGLTPSISH